MVKLFLSSIMIFSVLFSASAYTDDDPLKVLFIGNSYTHYNKMPAIFEKIAKSKDQKVKVLMSARSSHTFKMHSEREDLYEDIRREKWDYVVLQGFSRELSHSTAHIDSASIPYLDRLLDSIYANNPCTNVRFFMTWGYKTGIDYRPEVDTYVKMSDAVRNGYRYVSERYSIPIVPVGNVWREVRTKKPDLELYQKDGQHPTINGSYLIACTFYAALFNDTPHKGYRSMRVKRKNARLIQKAAYGYVSSEQSTFNLLNNTYCISADKEKGNFVVKCHANYPQASSILWEFGDGNSANGSKVVHAYQERGTYTVDLTIQDQCGRRREKVKVSFGK